MEALPLKPKGNIEMHFGFGIKRPVNTFQFGHLL